MLRERNDHPHINLGAIIFMGISIVAALVATKGASHATASYRNNEQSARMAASSSSPPSGRSVIDPNYVTWYNQPSPWPTPITGAYVGIGGALGAGNIYNTATNGFGSAGTGMLGTGLCAFLCYGAPGTASSNVLAVGNDVSALGGGSFTTIGAPDDCTTSSAPICPGGIHDQAFSVEYYANPLATPAVYLAIDNAANFAAGQGIYAVAAVIAGATGSPGAPSPNAGSLVSHTGSGQGDILLGAAGSGNYVKCDFGETQLSTLTCNEPLVIGSGATSAGLNGSGIVWSMGGVQPHSTSTGGSGGFAPEAFPLGAATAHPQVLTGTCSVTSLSHGCPFTGSFSGFPDTNYNCTVTAQGSTAVSDSYVKTSTTEISIYSSASATFSYTCIE
jgi:hypothetical protein